MFTGMQDRVAAWRRLGERWDLIVIGGGITGAGILHEATRVGLRVLLLEQNDFASGTSSRSSKLVHGGLRYLKNLQFRLTLESVRERDELLREGPGLIEILPFLYTTNKHDHLPGWMVEFGLNLYGWVAGKRHVYRSLAPRAIMTMVPGLSGRTLTGGFQYGEAQTDDARLVLRVIREGVAAGGSLAINYARVESLLRGEDGQVSGVRVCDSQTGRTYEVRAAAVVNATGAWADRLRAEVGAQPHLRPLRGSHLLFPHYRFPVFQSITFPHPDDDRPVFVFPWEGVTLLGTTDLDHEEDLDREPRIATEEVEYLLRAVHTYFPDLNLGEGDVLSTFSGIRPVISHDHDTDPSKESREYALWNEEGLLTVTGGKLTTFRCTGIEVLHALRTRLPNMAPFDRHLSALDPAPVVEEHPPDLTDREAYRLAARYGSAVLDFAAGLPAAEHQRIAGLPFHWLELRWAARHESVVHLDDLLLRRVRVGLLLPDGGQAILPEARAVAQEELGWGDARWEQEKAEYLARCRANYSIPGRSPVSAPLNVSRKRDPVGGRVIAEVGNEQGTS